MQGLRALADLIDNNPAVPIPWGIERGQVGWFVQGTIDDALAIRAVMDDSKITRTDSTNFPVDIVGRVAGMQARVQIVARLALAAGEAVAPPAPAMNPLLLTKTSVPS